MRLGRVFCLPLAICFFSFASNAVAQQEEDEGYRPGLLATYSSGEKEIRRFDSDLSFIWGEDAPDQRLSAAGFKAYWNGRLLVRQDGRYVIHVYLIGRVTVKIDSKIVLSATRASPGWISGGEFPLGFGEKAIDVQFEKTEPTARCHIFWSSDRFSLEPIPNHLLFWDGSDTQASRIERGRALYAAGRCSRCHRRANEPEGLVAPALTSAAAGTDFEWLVQKIQSQHTTDLDRMPSFGFAQSEARAVAVFLVTNSNAVKLSDPEKTKDKDTQTELRQGEVLLRSLGCLACHRIGKLGNASLLAGGDLSTIAEKRTPAWFNAWLRQPEKLNPDHRMPVFSLSSRERRELVLALSNLKRSDRNLKMLDKQSFDQETVARGRKLVEAARCAACHRIPGVKADLSKLPDLSASPVDWTGSCLQAAADRTKMRPAYRIQDVMAIKDYVVSRVGTLAPENQFTHGQRVLEERGCLACHERDQQKGIVAVAGQVAGLDESLKGQSQGLIPPALTAVGDKLLDDALRTAVSGEQKKPRLPWLHARMPKFKHSETDQAALLHYLIGHDRIPDGAPPAGAIHRSTAASSKPIDAQSLFAGRTLVGVKGFNCIACHAVGEYQPRNVALGTRGSDLLLLNKTLRPQYFLRWTRSPLRIIPGMEMPSYTKALPDLLAENIDNQLMTLWDALNDSRFKAPTNPSAVEQFFVVKPGQPARVVRDVFTNSKENGGGYIARAIAIGLNNGHNALFDLDTFALRQWCFGDFARQRTQGKSWYWDMAGVPVMTGVAPGSDFILKQKSDQGSTIGVFLPRLEHGRVGRLKSYARKGSGVTFSYEIQFDTGRAINTYAVTELIIPAATDDSEPAGWDRDIKIEQVPPTQADVLEKQSSGFEVLVARPKPDTTVGSPTIRICAAGSSPVRYLDKQWELFSEAPGREFISPEMASKPQALPGVNETGVWLAARIKLRYQCSLKTARLQMKPGEPATAQPVQTITSAPGFDGVELPLDRSIMPTAITWTPDGRLAIASLKGHVYRVRDSNQDELPDTLTVFEEGLAAPYGLIAFNKGLIVAHKPELLHLQDTDGDDRVDSRAVLATGWGYNDNYHDWTCGIVRDTKNNLYVGLGSDYAQNGRPREQSRWRGKVLRITPTGQVLPVGHAFRYPTGLAIDAADRLFVSDNQGVQNTFNEINWVQDGRHYGVPSLHEQNLKVDAMRPAVQVPHPLTRSVNGLFFLPNDFQIPEIAGHGVGCEFNGRFLVRFTYHTVGDSIQGAVYYLTRPDFKIPEQNFLGPLVGAVSPTGEIYIGSIHDSGWLGGQNTGSIVRLRPNGNWLNGIREIRGTPDGFEIRFFKPIDSERAQMPSTYSISGYTRIWEGSYATPDSGRYRVNVESVEVDDQGTRVLLHVDQLKAGYVYELTCENLNLDANLEFWPQTGHYTMNRIPN